MVGLLMNYFADAPTLLSLFLLHLQLVILLLLRPKVFQAQVIVINKAGSQTIDGETSVTIESPYGAVSMVYVAN
jgi:hypothetical protein